LFSKAAELGYKQVAAQLTPVTKPEEIARLRTTCSELSLDFVSRVDLRPRSPDELLVNLRKLRRKFELIGVLCETKEVSRQAARDHRVDLLNFPSLDYRRRFFDRAEAELASNSGAGFEVDMKPVLILEGPARIRFLNCLRREVALASEFALPIVISSGVSQPILMRKPREMALLALLFGLKGDLALDSISTNPIELIARNRKKLEAGFVAPGIHAIKQGDDC